MNRVFWKPMAILIAVSLFFGGAPIAYAEPTDASLVSDEGIAEGVESTQESENSVQQDETTPGSEANEEQPASSETEEDEGDLAAKNENDLTAEKNTGELDIAPLSIIGGDYVYQVDLEQTKGTTQANISLPNVQTLIDAGQVDRVVVEASMNYGGSITRNVSAEKELTTLVAEGGLFVLDFATYGKFSVVAKFYKGTELVRVGDTQTMGIVADEYNIAPVSASLPVAFFSLSLWGADSIRHDSSGNVIPTIMIMERPNAWNWEDLPEGVYPLPYLSEEDVSYQPPDFGAASDRFRSNSAALNAYVADLYEMSPRSTFNLYLVDYYLGLIQSVIYANRIPQEQYTITVLSDGTFSYSRFTEVYSGANPGSVHESLKTQWIKAKNEAYATGKVSSGYSLWEPNGALYAAVDAEPNAQWWVARPALLETKGDGGVFGKDVAQKDPQVVGINIAQKLRSLQATGDGAVQEFKALYNFSDTYFSDAEAAGKKVMLFLGTTVGSEAGTFSDYARFAMMYYGDDYAYYYKGHPGTPTDFYHEKQAELEALSITDVDSSIAAELILFFYPEISLSGYPSSTYASLTNSDMAKGMFNITKASAIQNESYAVMDWFMSRVTASSDAAIKALCKEGDTNYLVEYSDEQLSVLDYTIAIWDSTTSIASYYKLEDGKYTFVRSLQGGGNLVDGGVFTIGSKLLSDKTLDVAAASAASGANVQIYDTNESFAQRFKLNHVGGGYYTIQNAKSGKVLDVASAGLQPGTNVQQWEANGTDAQKWKLVDTGDGDGSYYVISKCNGLYLDQQWGQTTNGTNIWVYTGNGSNAQKFYLNKIDPVVADGNYIVHSSLSDSMVLDVTGGAFGNGANIQLYHSNGTAAQRFKFVFDASTGYYTVMGSQSGKNLDTMWGGSGSGTNVWQYEVNGSLAQSWSIKKNEDGSLAFYSATGLGCCLDVSAANTQDGANVQIWSPNGSAAQGWKLEEVA